MDIEAARCMLPPSLRCNDDGAWYFGNQRSTYETLCYLQSKHGLSNEWLVASYDKVKADPATYGTYAGLNDWSPVFTSEQLMALCAFVN